MKDAKEEKEKEKKHDNCNMPQQSMWCVKTFKCHGHTLQPWAHHH